MITHLSLCVNEQLKMATFYVKYVSCQLVINDDILK